MWWFSCWVGGWLGFPTSAGIPRGLASLVRAPFALRKGRTPFVLRTFPPLVGENLGHPSSPAPSPRPSPPRGEGDSSPPVHPWVPAFAGMTVVVQE